MTDLIKLSEEELMGLMRKDELGAFKEIYARYWKSLYAEAFRRLKSKESAEEVVQEVFTNFWSKKQQLQVNENINAYFKKAVFNLIIDQHRKNLVKSKYQQEFRTIQPCSDNATENVFMLKELHGTLASEISHLPEKCRSVYELSRNEHKSNKEIALHLGISEKTVENHITKALKKIKVGLGDYFLILLLLLFR